MLLQSQNGAVRVFPAIPGAWQDVSFTTLRAEGALLVTGVRSGGKTQSVKIVSEKGGLVRMADPFAGHKFKTKARGITVIPSAQGFIEFKSTPAGVVEFTLD
jgi:alpha-L-fucosidase 2